MRFPESSVELIKELERMYPERLPEKGETLEDVQRYAGRREVVLFLKHWRDEAVRAAAREDRTPRVRR